MAGETKHDAAAQIDDSEVTVEEMDAAAIARFAILQAQFPPGFFGDREQALHLFQVAFADGADWILRLAREGKLS